MKAMTFDNGMMVASLDEMINVLQDVDPDVFAVSAKKNDFSIFAKEVDAGLATSLDKKTNKAEVLKLMQDFAQSKKPKSDEDEDGEDEDEDGEGDEGGEGGEEEKEE